MGKSKKVSESTQAAQTLPPKSAEAAITFTDFDRLLSRIHRAVFVRNRVVACAVSILLYVGGMWLLSRELGVSSNFLVILPLVAAALGWGLPGGLLVGALGLPMNLLLFWLLGHPEFSPQSKLAAEISGIVLGISLGYLSDYFKKLEREIERRNQIDAELRRTLGEKEVLLQEVHHRVKNNLSVIKSLIQLQANRSEVPGFREAAEQLKGRIFSIFLIHELLYVHQDISAIGLDSYITTLTDNVVSGNSESPQKIRVDLNLDPISVHLETAVPLGLIINEVCTNTLRHAFVGRENGSISITLRHSEDSGLLDIQDDGAGFALPSEEDIGLRDGLGLRLIPLLVEQLQGRFRIDAKPGKGTHFSLEFPLKPADPALSEDSEL